MVGLELGLGLGTKRAGAFSRKDHPDGRHDVQRDRQGRQRDDENKRTRLSTSPLSTAPEAKSSHSSYFERFGHQ